MNFKHACRGLRSGLQAVVGLVPLNRSVARPEMRIAIALVVVQMRGTDAILQLVENGSYTIAKVGMAHVQAHADVGEVSRIENFKDIRGARDVIGYVFDQQ